VIRFFFGLEVPPVVPFSRSPCQASPSQFPLGNHRYYVPLRLPKTLLRFVRSSLSSPDTSRASPLCVFLLMKERAHGRKHSATPRALDLPVPLIFRVFPRGSFPALPSSRVTPLSTCPGLRPRWYPSHSPYRIKGCCIPFNAERRLSPATRDYPNDHNYTFFGGQYRACVLDPSSFVLRLPGLHVDFTTGPLAKL
jgi:hypothetical protein